LIEEISKDLVKDKHYENAIIHQETSTVSSNHYSMNHASNYPEIILPKIKLEKITSSKKKKKKFISADEQGLKIYVKELGYSKAEIQEKIERKGMKCGRVEKIKEKAIQFLTEPEIKRKQ
jgi:hypothetical protein